MLQFDTIIKYGEGIVFSLLAESFGGLWNEELQTKLRQFDDEVFANPETVGRCVFISILDSRPVGMASWDPRQRPIGIIGYNGIVPAYQGRGCGKMQIREVLRRLQEQGFRKAAVTTGEHPFFAPAVKMYLACGFKEMRRYPKSSDLRYGAIEFEMDL